jgi:hypothetical protein
MRAVYRQDPSKDRGPAQKALRKFFDKDPNAFLRRLEHMEQSSAALKEDEREDSKPQEDVGLEESIESVNECMRQRDTKRAAEDAEFAKRPDAAEKGASLQRALNAAVERETRSREREEKLRKELAELRRRK